MRGKKDNVEWNKNILASICPFCNHTTTTECTSVGVFDLKKCPNCGYLYRIPQLRVCKHNGEFYITLNEDYEVTINGSEPSERWELMIDFWQKNGWVYSVMSIVNDFKLVMVHRYTGFETPCDFKYYVLDKDNKIILNTEEPVSIELDKDGDKIIIRGEINA